MQEHTTRKKVFFQGNKSRFIPSKQASRSSKGIMLMLSNPWPYKNFRVQFWFCLQATFWLACFGSFIWLAFLMPKQPLPPEIVEFDRLHKNHMLVAFLTLCGFGYLIQNWDGNRRQRIADEAKAKKRQTLRAQLKKEEAAYHKTKTVAGGGNSTPNANASSASLYYHVLIETSGYPQWSFIGTLEKRDLSREKLDAQFIRPFTQNEAINIGGTTVPAPTSPKQKRQMFVFCTGEEPAAVFCDRHERKHPDLATNGRISNIELCCDDIFNSLINETYKNHSVS